MKLKLEKKICIKCCIKKGRWSFHQHLTYKKILPTSIDFLYWASQSSSKLSYVWNNYRKAANISMAWKLRKLLKISKSWKQFMLSSILPKNEKKRENKYFESSQDNFHVFYLFFGRIENSKNCFQDLATFIRCQQNNLLFESNWAT